MDSWDTIELLHLVLDEMSTNRYLSLLLQAATNFAAAGFGALLGFILAMRYQQRLDRTKGLVRILDNASRLEMGLGLELAQFSQIIRSQGMLPAGDLNRFIDMSRRNQSEINLVCAETAIFLPEHKMDAKAIWDSWANVMDTFKRKTPTYLAVGPSSFQWLDISKKLDKFCLALNTFNARLAEQVLPSEFGRPDSVSPQ